LQNKASYGGHVAWLRQDRREWLKKIEVGEILARRDAKSDEKQRDCADTEKDMPSRLCAELFFNDLYGI
jgi:hypothetical protein